ncbi:MAG: hypothetical protein LQ341_002813 [Variospora aurantia]|nr:MAG: hypothetical protein LQ341_002813 [Variospora aurantia]
MLVGAEKGKHVKYRLHDSQKAIALEDGQSHVLYQRSNTFRVGNLYYTLVFTAFDADQYTQFVTRRNEILDHYGFPAPHSSLSAVWQHQDTKSGPAILHSSLAFGTYGWVHAAVDARTGQPLAIKRHSVQSRKQAAAVRGEVKVGLAFNEEQGLMPINKSWCEHETERVCNVFPQQIYTSSPLAMHDFSCLQASGLSTRELIEFLRGPLEGLANLHQAGYIHRDVSMKNIFVLSLNPPRAVLGDFGKTIRAQSHKDRQIGPIKTLAPEVDGSTYYDAKIDIWSWGVVFMCAFAPYLNHLYDRMSTPQWHHRATDWLAEKENELGLDSLAAQLIRYIRSKDLLPPGPWNTPAFIETLLDNRALQSHRDLHTVIAAKLGLIASKKAVQSGQAVITSGNGRTSEELTVRPVYSFKRNRHRRLQDASMPKRLTSLDSNLNSKLNSNPAHTQNSYHQYYLPRRRAYSHHYCAPRHQFRPPTALCLGEIGMRNPKRRVRRPQRHLVLRARMAKVGSTFMNDDRQQADHPSRHREGYYDADEQARLTDHGLSPTNVGD